VSATGLRALVLQLEAQAGALRPQITSALAVHGQPLRWAITAVTRSPSGGRLLQVEAVLLSADAQPGTP